MAHIVEASLIGRVWHEFDGQNEVLIKNLGPTFKVTDDFGGTFGEVAGLVNVLSKTSGWSGFAKGGVKFNGDFYTVTDHSGLRYTW
jgi:hypothetical protein